MNHENNKITYLVGFFFLFFFLSVFLRRQGPTVLLARLASSSLVQELLLGPWSPSYIYSEFFCLFLQYWGLNSGPCIAGLCSTI
jgi:hypothetical protein